MYSTFNEHFNFNLTIKQWKLAEQWTFTTTIYIQNFQCLKVKSKMAKCQNGKMAKFQNGKIANWQNGKMTKWQNDKMTKWQNGKMTKCQNGKIEKL